jgi:succinoglycan biosynthesis transport protein ExoP
MSRNFDLLTEIEHEQQAEPLIDSTRIATDRSAVATSFPAEEVVARPEMVQLVRRVFLVTGRENLRQVVFCGVEGENGSSSICAGAGRALASVSSKSVCLVDGNIDSPKLSRLFGVESTVPLPGTFTPVREQCVQVGKNLWLAGTHLITKGRGSLLPLEDLQQRLAELDRTFDFLLFDAPAICDSSDAEILGQFADAAILVVEADKTRRTSAAKAKESLDFAGIKLLGTILNNRSSPIPEKLYNLL